MDAITLHGSETQLAERKCFSPEAFEASIEVIRPAALALHNYWQEQRMAQPETLPPLLHFTGEKTDRNHPCPCNRGKKYKQCCGK